MHPSVATTVSSRERCAASVVGLHASSQRTVAFWMGSFTESAPRGGPESSRASWTTTRTGFLCTSAARADIVDSGLAPPSRRARPAMSAQQSKPNPTSALSTSQARSAGRHHSLASHLLRDDQTPRSPVVRLGARLPAGMDGAMCRSIFAARGAADAPSSPSCSPIFSATGPQFPSARSNAVHGRGGVMKYALPVNANESRCVR
jgi:hypothetical protein